MAIEITNRRPTTFEAVLDSWAEAELSRPHGAWLAPGTLQRFASRAPTQWDREVARYALFCNRSPMLGSFLSSPAGWFEADINVDGLAEVATSAYWRRVEHNHAGDYNSLGDLADKHPDMTIPNFDPAQSQGRPVMVSVTGTSPWYLIEGGHRCCEIIRLRRAGKFGDKLPVIIGVCPQAGQI